MAALCQVQCQVTRCQVTRTMKQMTAESLMKCYDGQRRREPRSEWGKMTDLGLAWAGASSMGHSHGWSLTGVAGRLGSETQGWLPFSLSLISIHSKGFFFSTCSLSLLSPAQRGQISSILAQDPTKAQNCYFLGLLKV